MIKKVFVDTDIILDVALARKEFVENSKLILALAENNYFQCYTSSVIIKNVYYILRKSGGDSSSRIFLKSLLKYISILSVDQNDIENAIESNFTDFEDAVQHSVAVRNHCDLFVTRNIFDFKLATLQVYLPIELIKIFKEKL